MSDRSLTVLIMDSGVHRFYLGTVVAGSICIGIEYGWLVGVGIGLISFSVLGGMDEVANKIHKLDVVQRANANDHYTQLTSLNDSVKQLRER